MKAIMLSIRPKYVSMILNKTKTIEVRKRFPKDYKGWVYIYCTKDKNLYLDKSYKGYCLGLIKDYIKQNKVFETLNGKVVARFYCDKVEEIYNSGEVCVYYKTKTLDENTLLKKSYLHFNELFDYLGRLEKNKGYAIHISQLEIFDKPKEISEFGYFCKNNNKRESVMGYCQNCGNKNCWYGWIDLTKPPQNFCYVEVEND